MRALLKIPAIALFAAAALHYMNSGPGQMSHFFMYVVFATTGLILWKASTEGGKEGD